MPNGAIGLLALGALGLGGCMAGTQDTAGPAPSAAAAMARTTLHTADGADVGRVTAAEMAGGLRVTVAAMALPPGPHGLHIHTVGKCEAPGFTTAGGHWNPTMKMHGAMNPQGPHEGDLPNLVIGADGKGTIGFTIPGATLAGLLDADGAAMMVHAGADDLMTDPAGNSGARIACGVFG